MAVEGLALEHFAFVKDLKPIVYIVAGITWAFLLYTLYRGFVRWTLGGQKITLHGGLGGVLSRFLKYGLLQYKVLRHRFPGTMHLLIFGGMMWLLVATILRAADSYLGPFLVGNYLKAFKLISNIAGASVLVGSTIAIIRRWRGLTPNLPKDPSYYLVHILFIIIVVTGFMLDGMASAGYRAEYESPTFDPVGYIFFSWASNLDSGTLQSYYRALWVFHLS